MRRTLFIGNFAHVGVGSSAALMCRELFIGNASHVGAGSSAALGRSIILIGSNPPRGRRQQRGARSQGTVSHGEMIRSGYDQQLTINACKLQYLYQGTAPKFQGDYSLIPYRLGLITQQ